MDDKFLNLSGLSLFLKKIKSIFATAAQGAKADTAYTHSQSTHAPSNAERNTIVGIQKNGLDLGINSSRKVNIAVPTRTSELTNDSGFKTSDNNTTYTLSKSGNRITLQGSDGTSTYVTDSDTTYTTSTTSSNGLMSYSDKLKLDNIDSYANNYIHPSYTSKSNGLYKITVDSTGHVSGAATVTKSDITSLGIPSQDTNTTYTAGTGLTLNGTQFKHSNSITSGSVGPTSSLTLENGGSFVVPRISYDAQGHITSTYSRTLTLPNVSASNGLSIDVSKIIIIGDSFTEGYTPDSSSEIKPWAEYLIEFLGDKVEQSYILGRGGSGFSHKSATYSTTFINVWSEAKQNCSWYKDCTCFILMGGWNDNDQSEINVNVAVKMFWNRIRTDCPNASLLYFFNPGCKVGTRATVETCYNEIPYNVNINVLAYDSWWWGLLDEELYASDHIHQNEEGHKRFAWQVYQSMRGADVNHMTALELDPQDGMSCRAYVHNENITLYMNGSVSSENRAKTIGRFPSWLKLYETGSPIGAHTVDTVGVVSSGTTIGSNINIAYGGTNFDQSIYAIRTEGTSPTGTFFYTKTLNALMWLSK